jgi:phosphopantetheine--protein transferase-like protein
MVGMFWYIMPIRFPKTSMNIGIDIISSDQFKRLERTDYPRWKHVFSVEEWDYAFSDGVPHLHLAGIFCAKESVMKGTGHVGKKHYRTFEVAHDDHGAPSITGHAYKISISHHGGMVVAVALIP